MTHGLCTWCHLPSSTVTCGVNVAGAILHFLTHIFWDVLMSAQIKQAKGKQYQLYETLFFLLELWLHCSCLYWSACHLPAKFSLLETFASSSSLALGASGPLPPIHGPSYGPSSSAQANKQNSYGVDCVEKSTDPMGHMAHRQWEERLCALWHIVTIAASIARLLIARSLDTSSHLLTTSRSFSVLYFSRLLGCTSVCGIHAITCTAKKR